MLLPNDSLGSEHTEERRNNLNIWNSKSCVVPGSMNFPISPDWMWSEKGDEDEREARKGRRPRSTEMCLERPATSWGIRGIRSRNRFAHVLRACGCRLFYSLAQSLVTGQVGASPRQGHGLIRKSLSPIPGGKRKRIGLKRQAGDGIDQRHLKTV